MEVRERTLSEHARYSLSRDRQIERGAQGRSGICYFPHMKNKDKGSVTAPVLKDLMDRERERKANMPAISNKPEQASDLAHDPGNGYNPGFVFPQD